MPMGRGKLGSRTWPGSLREHRLSPFRPGRFTSPLHHERTAALLGMALGISFVICFATGLISHGIQNPPGWFLWPSRPVNLYRVLQGTHVAAGIATIPLLLAKLWTVFPRLFTWPPARSVAHGLERLSLLPLVAGSVFLLLSGLNNIALWYPWQFFFPAAHYWAAWITLGALVVHVGAKISVTRRALRSPGSGEQAGRPGGHTPANTGPAAKDPPGHPVSGWTTPQGGLTRRGFLAAVGASAAAVTLSTIGQTVRPLRRLSLLAPRDPAVGPQGFPVNKTARSAGVTTSAVDPAWRLRVEGAVTRPLALSLQDLQALPQHSATLPIACVEGWSATVDWTGVALADLLRLAGAAEGAEVVAESLQARGLYRRSSLNRLHAWDPDTLVALGVNGELLHLEHGFPARIVGPNRPGVMQTKWLDRLVVT